MAAIPTTVLTGFLGEPHGKRYAAIVNEFGVH
ncbi:hypothetical protein ANOBCDAF_04167 [Pleomorphomonas sp. T1.2MG-36]|nr:hypothetical protein ANOBCDAF_04167 [Pleomorphomonas sp. T1.2MG-36]